MTECSKCAIQERLMNKSDIKISNADVLSRVIFEKINKNSLKSPEEIELEACGSKISKEKNVSMTTALKICSKLQKNKKKDYY